MKLTKKEYFIASVAENLQTTKTWQIRCWSIQEEPKWELGGEPVTITDWKPGTALFDVIEEVTFKAGELPNVTETVRSTYGMALLNSIVLIYVLGDRVPYVNRYLKAGFLEEVILDLRKTDRATVQECKAVLDAHYSMTGLSTLIIPAASERTMTPNKAMLKRKKELLAECNGDFSDIKKMVRIEKELVDMDKEGMKGDTGEDFYIKGKHYDIIRKKLYVMTGVEAGLDGAPPTVIPGSLMDGLEPDYMVEAVNSVRHGIAERGSSTAKGGEAAKFLGRVYHNTRIAEDDCGTTDSITVLITERNYMKWVDTFTLDGKLSTEASMRTAIGRNVKFRSPMTCKTKHANHCRVCMGPSLDSSPNAPAMQAVSVGNTMMYIAMAAMHGKSITLVSMDIDLDFQ